MDDLNTACFISGECLCLVHSAFYINNKMVLKRPYSVKGDPTRLTMAINFNKDNVQVIRVCAMHDGDNNVSDWSSSGA